ncbi:MAG: AlbA family DNA-binding domain-containing protein [Candidatus Altimarinota bacterium]
MEKIDKLLKKGLKEEFANLLNDPDRIKFSEFLKNNTGEQNHVDFKLTWLEIPKLARHILAFSNAGGGILVFGISEELDKSMLVVGLNEIKDKTHLKSLLNKFIPSELEYGIYDFFYEGEAEWAAVRNKKFQLLIIEDMPQNIPFLALADYGNDLQKNEIYYRGKVSSEIATHEELKLILNRRIATNIVTSETTEFRKHLEKLQILYTFMDKRIQFSPWELDIANPFTKENPLYPEESFEKFVRRMIDKKKEIIEKN